MSCYREMVFSLTIVLIAFLVPSGQQDWIKKECYAQQNSWDAYQENKVMGLLKVIDETSDEIGCNNYHPEGLGSTGTCYIHATCSRNIKREDCSSCLENAADKINRECRLSIGAWVDYINCIVEFKNYKFY